MGSRKNTTRPPRAAGDRSGLWLYGAHAVLAALANPNREITRLVVTSEAAKRHVGELRRAAETIEGVRLASMLPSGAVHQGIAALAKPLADLHIEDCKPDTARCVVLVLDQVTDPRNVGAILRSAAAFGAKAVVVPAHHSPPESGALAKAASGALEKVPFIRVPNLARGLEQLADQGYWRVALTADGPTTLNASKHTGHVALVLGGEGAGLRRLTAERCDTNERLPTKNGASLNVSVAASIALYEFARQ